MNLRFAGKAIATISKHGPAILTAAGIVGNAATIFFASKATMSVGEVIWDDLCKMTVFDGSDNYTAEERLQGKIQGYTSIAKKLTVHYAPSIILFAASTTSLIMAQRISSKRIAGLTIALGATEEAYRKFKDRIVAELGEDTVEKIIKHAKENEYEVRVNELKVQKPDAKEVVPSQDDFLSVYGDSPYAAVLDQNASAWEYSEDLTLMTLHAQERYANDVLKTKGFLILNDVYRSLGLPESSVGAVVGWIYKDGVGDGYVSFGDYETNTRRVFDPATGRTVTEFALDFNVDGAIYDKIDQIKTR